jgi:hypothetical protein
MKQVKAFSFKEMIEDVKRRQAEFEALPEEEQRQIIEQRDKAIKEFYSKGGTAMGFAVGGKK